MTLIGYARCSTDEQDLTAQRQTLLELGVDEALIYLDHGLTGANRDRPGLDQALAAVRAGDTLVVPKLDRLARSVPDARDIGDSLAARGVALSLGGTVYDPDDPMGKLFFNILATFAEFELDLLRARTREGMAIAKAKGKLRGRQPKLTKKQQTELQRMHANGEHTGADLAEIFSVSRATVYRTINRTPTTTETAAPATTETAAPATTETTAPTSTGSTRVESEPSRVLTLIVYQCSTALLLMAVGLVGPLRGSLSWYQPPVLRE